MDRSSNLPSSGWAADQRCTFELLGDYYVHGLMNGKELAAPEDGQEDVDEPSRLASVTFSSGDTFVEFLVTQSGSNSWIEIVDAR